MRHIVILSNIFDGNGDGSQRHKQIFLRADKHLTAMQPTACFSTEENKMNYGLLRFNPNGSTQ